MRKLGPEFDVFVRDATPRLLRLGFRLTGDPHLAEDLVQSALWRVARNWPRASGNPIAYARTTLINLSTDLWRSRAVRVAEVSGPIPERAADVTQDDANDALLAALKGLAPRQRAVIVLRYWEGLSVEETATAMRCSTGTVKSTASKAIAQLRTHLTPQGARP